MGNKVKFALRVCGWLIIALVTLELCARTEDKIRYGAPFFSNYSLDTLYTYDALGKYGRPNASYLKWHLNEVGYRGPALRPDTYRIACLGSSETFGLYESPENEWPRQLERILNSNTPGQPYEVVDAAYPGLSTATSLRRLPQLLSAVHPKLVVIYPSYTPYIELNHPLQLDAPPPRVRKPASHIEFRLSSRLDTFMKSVLPTPVQRWLRARSVKHDAQSVTVMDRLPEQNIQAFKTDLNTLVQQLSNNGVHVVLVTHANRFGAHPSPEDLPLLTDWRKFFPTLQEQGFLDMEQRMSDAVRQVAADHSIPLVDAANIIQPGRGNFAEFVHFTDAGSYALATAVAAKIEQPIPDTH